MTHRKRKRIPKHIMQSPAYYRIYARGYTAGKRIAKKPEYDQIPNGDELEGTNQAYLIIGTITCLIMGFVIGVVVTLQF